MEEGARDGQNQIRVDTHKTAGLGVVHCVQRICPRGSSRRILRVETPIRELCHSCHHQPKPLLSRGHQLRESVIYGGVNERSEFKSIKTAHRWYFAVSEMVGSSVLTAEEDIVSTQTCVLSVRQGAAQKAGLRHVKRNRPSNALATIR